MIEVLSSMKLKRLLTVVGLVLSIAAGSVTAQNKKKEDSTTRTVQGVVTDAADNPAQQAVVQLKDTKTLSVRSFITQNDGLYHFAGLSTNVDYELKAEKQGTSSKTTTLSVFDSRKKATINLKLSK